MDDEQRTIEFYFLSPGWSRVDEQGVELLDELGKEQVADACQTLEEIEGWDRVVMHGPGSSLAFDTALAVIGLVASASTTCNEGLTSEMTADDLRTWMNGAASGGRKMIFVAILSYATASQLLDSDEELLVAEAAIVKYVCHLDDGELIIEASETLISF